MRQLEPEHQKLWDHLSPPTPEMVAAKDCDPVLLSGWTDRDISLWDVSGVGGKVGLRDILIALCRKKDSSWKKISYLLFPRETVSLVGLSLTASNGKTGTPRVDLSDTHFEIKDITGKELCTLLFHVSSSGEFKTGIFTKKEMDDILFEAFEKHGTATTRPVVQAATSPTPSVSLPSSGTGVQAVTTVVPPEQAASETLTTEHVPRPSSSTTLP
jgi:hypothetical protein